MKKIVFVSLGLILLGLSSCDSCRFAPTYEPTHRGSMIYGHDTHDIIVGKFSKTPYSVKPVKQHVSNFNPNAHHWWDN